MAAKDEVIRAQVEHIGSLKEALAKAEARADTLRDRLEATQAELTEMVDAARVATEAADGLRVAEAARKARRRLARLRAAWRGE